MKTIEEKKRDRFLFLKAIFDSSNGSQDPVDAVEIGKDLHFDEKSSAVQGL